MKILQKYKFDDIFMLFYESMKRNNETYCVSMFCV